MAGIKRKFDGNGNAEHNPVKQISKKPKAQIEFSKNARFKSKDEELDDVDEGEEEGGFEGFSDNNEDGAESDVESEEISSLSAVKTQSRPEEKFKIKGKRPGLLPTTAC